MCMCVYMCMCVCVYMCTRVHILLCACVCVFLMLQYTIGIALNKSPVYMSHIPLKTNYDINIALSHTDWNLLFANHPL